MRWNYNAFNSCVIKDTVALLSWWAIWCVHCIACIRIQNHIQVTENAIIRFCCRKQYGYWNHFVLFICRCCFCRHMSFFLVLWRFVMLFDVECSRFVVIIIANALTTYSFEIFKQQNNYKLFSWRWWRWYPWLYGCTVYTVHYTTIHWIERESGRERRKKKHQQHININWGND